MSKINVIIPPVWSGVYLNTAKLLKYTFEDLGISSKIVVAGTPSQSDMNVVLGWNLIPEFIILKRPYIIYQLEPLVFTLWQDKFKEKIKLFKNANAIWEYSTENLKYLERAGFNARLVPLGYHKNLDKAKIPEFYDYDVLFVGYATDRRKKIFDELQKFCCVSVQPRWGKDYLDALSRSKILLNVHQYDARTPLEQPRIAYALNNRCFVVSEKAIDKPYDELASATYDNLPETVQKFLYDPAELSKMRELAYNSFKKIKMKDYMGDLFK